jgi:hypothetical protein
MLKLTSDDVALIPNAPNNGGGKGKAPCQHKSEKRNMLHL